MPRASTLVLVLPLLLLLLVVMPQPHPVFATGGQQPHSDDGSSDDCSSDDRGSHDWWDHSSDDCGSDDRSSDDRSSDDDCEPESPRCGDGHVDMGEQCDDGNQKNRDACKNDCTHNVCGDGVVRQGVEQCDDGNDNDNDGCRNDCTVNNQCDPVCGDGKKQGNEQCDDGNHNQNDACKNDCTPNVCGDGVVRDGVEECDDGNTTNGDGCSADCRDEQEICNNMMDDDGDGLIDCQDPECSNLPPCQVIRDDPALIKFLDGLDLLKGHGRITPTTSIDPSNERVGIVISNAGGDVYRAVLEPGDLVKKGKKWVFRDKRARAGNGIRDGIASFHLYQRRTFGFSFQAYGDASRATLARMTIHLWVGDDEFTNTSDWKATPNGWKLNDSDLAP